MKSLIVILFLAMNTIVYSQLVYLLDESFQSELPKSWGHCSTNWGKSEIWHIDSGYLQESSKYFGRTLNGLLLPYVELDDIANPILEIEYALGEIKSATHLSIYYASNDSCTTLKNWNLITSFNKTNDIKSSKWIPTDMDFKTIQVKLDSFLFKSNIRIGIGSDYKNGLAEGKFYIKSLKIYGASKAKSQTSDCVNQLDTAEIIKIAKKKIPLLDTNKQCAKNKYSISNIYFNEKSCEWKVYASKSKHTSKGKCEFSGINCKVKPECTATTNITLIIDANSKTIKKRSKVKHKKHNFQFVDDTPIHTIEREVPVPKIYTLQYILEMYELINDSTLSEKPISMSVIYQNKDTLLLEYYLSKLSWDRHGSCEPQGITYIPSHYFYSSRIDLNGHFSELKVIRSGNSIECTESFMKLIHKAASNIKVLDAQYLNKDICFRLKVSYY